MDCKYLASGTFLFLVLSSVQPLNVLLICPTPSFSHQQPFHALGKDLVRRGHTVTMVGTDPLKEPLTNYTDIDLSASYKFFKPRKEKIVDAIDNQRKLTGYQFVKNIATTVNAYTEDQLGSKEMQQFLKDIDEKRIKFDLVVYEGLVHTAYLGFVHKLGYPPLISMLTINPTCLFGMHSDVMICNPSYLPEIMTGYSQSMSFMERIDNAFIYLYTYFYLKPIILRKKQDLLMANYFGTGELTGDQLEGNKTLLFISSSWFMTYPRPTFPNTILLGSLHLEDPRPLPRDLKDWIDGAKDGLIYFSLGSNMQSSSLKEDKRKAILDSFRQFPSQRVIWKWENDTLPDIPSNVMCKKWLPQNDILAHPNVKLFIMQGGLQSSQEAIHFSVPLIGIPFFSDQEYNVRRMESAGIARFLDYEDITADTLTRTIKSVLYNKTIYEKIQTVSKLSSSPMMSPKDTAYWWIQYVLTAKGNVDHLKVNLNNIAWYKYYFVDVAVVLLGAFLLAVYLLLIIMRFLFSSCFKNKKKIKKS